MRTVLHNPPRPKLPRSPAATLPKIWIGPAGWSYTDWRGIVYPSYPHGSGKELETVAELFDVVEINTSFYRPLRPEVSRVWLRKCAVNPRFRFTAKLYRRFTHERDASAAEEREFKEGIAPLMDAGKLGALLLQFPWSFKNAPENRQYLAGLLLRFHDYPLVVEIRHASWVMFGVMSENKPDVLHLLEEYRAGFCNLDQPVIGRSLAPTENVTAPIGYVRLHGRNYASWFAESAGVDLRYDYLYSREELEEWQGRIESIAARSQDTYVIVNNHYQGKAVANAIQLRSMTEDKRFSIPPPLLARYPQLSPCAAPPVFEDTLFRLR
ncbi:MAG: DUF72 domain-containing protein [Acidobacteria bacterium]|nr:DUF72 domain-containing protein [Acidobacteriota bacterium]